MGLSLKAVLMVWGVLSTAVISIVGGIQCFECDEFPGASSRPCPGGRLITFGHKYDACIVYRLKSGRIVYQQEVQSGSENNLCHQNPSFLQDVIRTNFGEEGNAMCCKQDGCNKDVPQDFERNSQVLFLEDFDRGQSHHQKPKPYEKADYRASAAILSPSAQLVALLGTLLSHGLRLF
ncbi:hypothetical protein TCAL_13936 [Tigriopus californicus]|uniref:Protein quiver n=1 Tax=Tigriopus californicus TaxID=6832 RepID=A0A553NFK1_TIGCA|nr:uncharacterized protein LOC131888596 [Tigriopus californicus]XP_059093476.1 uncharacterized protein LOC131888596 [Tigriopus californicus]XP_059093477.1 uncharacterized protein LOC131888596 [Tigriopus californicus]XP_059093478.1 uncharacterized protein LOC131888596 [Tigriopus californicus]XP_059093479.1 uncharacterized protein LOC131888596 [Tigriopus californicus]TRY64232.1 hypothetical protein TCAL_13936 [Tigriopus californicus]